MLGLWFGVTVRFSTAAASAGAGCTSLTLVFVELGCAAGRELTLLKKII